VQVRGGLGEEIRVPWNGMELRVFVQGTPGNHAIVTVHDIGLNHRSCFAGFLGHPRAEGLLRICCFYHIDLPGQSDGVRNISFALSVTSFGQNPWLDEELTDKRAVATTFLPNM